MTERERILLALEKARTYQDENYDIWYNADDVEKAMKEYAEQRIREELKKFYKYATPASYTEQSAERLIEHYLKQRQK